ncbi:phosphatase PAP2 family protein [Ornithobacterium rhinotracheale]|uniref:phosphatase PAP2 family protein n=1 Tax=Ornithobacterium rhinotracheale TaxID=28251 RepID=UPI003FA40D07
MNKFVINNYRKISLYLLLLPIAIIVFIFIFLYINNALSNESYVQIQKEYFYFINSKLSQFPSITFNLTQIGDPLIFLSFLTIFIVYAPKLWEALIPSLLVSVLFSFCLKELFSVPRPSVVFNNDSFIIIGKVLGGYSSLPSGHSITTFTLLTVILLGFNPKNLKNKILWTLLCLTFGIIIIATRVGVGAHHPLDTIIGSAIGILSGLLGIFISRKYKIWDWVNHKKYYPIFIFLFLGSIFALIFKIIEAPLFIFYLAVISLILSLYVITKTYLQK